MAFKQPRIPEYRESEGAGKYLKSLVLFLKDFCMESWVAAQSLEKKIGNIKMPEIPEVPVKSVNGKTGNVQLTAADVGAVPAEGWLNKVYPVGSIYMSVNETSPAELFGGTWEQMKDRFLLGAGGSYSSGATGGEETHKLTVDELASHNHNAYVLQSNIDGSSSGKYYTIVHFTNNGGTNNGTNSAMVRQSGGSVPHNNMPPYIAVNIWKRTA